MRKITASLLFSAILAIAGQGGKQPLARGASSPEYELILKQMELLNVSVELDRREYLPGEMICATIHVENPTAQKITAIHPFRSDYSGRLWLMFLRDNGKWDVMRPGPYGEPANPLDGRSVVQMAPGQRLSESGCYGQHNAGRAIEGHSFGMLETGIYKAWFDYEKRAESDFRVLRPEGKPEFARVPLPEMASVVRFDSPTSTCYGVLIAAVPVQGSTVLVRSSPLTYLCDSNLQLDDLGRFTRITEVAGQVTGLATRLLPDDSAEVFYTDARGETNRHLLAKPEVRRDPSGKVFVDWKDGQYRERRWSVSEPGAR